MKRYERKFIFDKGNLDLIYQILKNFGYQEEYPKRELTSIYYDSTDFFLYKLSVYGVSERKKIRIRFYNNNVSDAIIEYKFKSGELGWKEFSEIDSQKYNPIKKLEIQNKLFNDKLYIPITIDKIYQPNLMVIYTRNYFKSKISLNRITLDNNIKFKKIFKTSSLNNFQNFIENINPVLEVKYDHINSPDYKIIDFFSKYLNLNYTRFSKYCEGIESCF